MEMQQTQDQTDHDKKRDRQDPKYRMMRDRETEQKHDSDAEHDTDLHTKKTEYPTRSQNATTNFKTDQG